MDKPDFTLPSRFYALYGCFFSFSCSSNFFPRFLQIHSILEMEGVYNKMHLIPLKKEEAKLNSPNLYQSAAKKRKSTTLLMFHLFWDSPSCVRKLFFFLGPCYSITWNDNGEYFKQYFGRITLLLAKRYKVVKNVLSRASATTITTNFCWANERQALKMEIDELRNGWPHPCQCIQPLLVLFLLRDGQTIVSSVDSFSVFLPIHFIHLFCLAYFSLSIFIADVGVHFFIPLLRH